MFFLFLFFLNKSSVPNPPLNISHKIVHLNQRAVPGEAPNGVLPEGSNGSSRASRQARELALYEEDEETEDHHGGEENMESIGATTLVPYNPTRNITEPPIDYGLTNINVNSNDTMEGEAVTRPYWLDPTDALPPADRDDEFVNAVVPEYEDSNEPGSAMGLPSEPSIMPTRLPPILLELRWLPPRPPTIYDGFNIYIYRDGKHGAMLGISNTSVGDKERILIDVTMGPK